MYACHLTKTTQLCSLRTYLGSNRVLYREEIIFSVHVDREFDPDWIFQGGVRICHEVGIAEGADDFKRFDLASEGHCLNKAPSQVDPIGFKEDRFANIAEFSNHQSQARNPRLG